MPNSDEGFAALPPTRKTGQEFFRRSQPLAFTLLDFWRWSASDLVSNATRGVLAEFIVASALGLAANVRAEWDAFDLLTSEGIKVEVKSAAYLQSWFHKKLSPISFSIRPTVAQDAEGLVQRKRQADVYIFCLLNHLEKATLDPLNLDQWEFYILPASVLDEKLQNQKTVGLAKLLTLNPQIVNYDEIAPAIQAADLALKGQLK